MRPNLARRAELENELVELARKRAALTVSDRECIAVDRRVHGARMLAHRAGHHQEIVWGMALAPKPVPVISRANIAWAVSDHGPRFDPSTLTSVARPVAWVHADRRRKGPDPSLHECPASQR